MRHVLALFFVILLGFAATAPAQAGGKGCDERCEFLKHTPGTGLKPAIKDETCFRFNQWKPGFATFTLYDVYTKDVKHVLRRIKHKKPDGVRGEFCVGNEKWVSKAVWEDLCNGPFDSERGLPSLREGMRTGVVEQCLLGDERCSRFVR